jgi:hypothetical protein
MLRLWRSNCYWNLLVLDDFGKTCSNHPMDFMAGIDLIMEKSLKLPMNWKNTTYN